MGAILMRPKIESSILVVVGVIVIVTIITSNTVYAATVIASTSTSVASASTVVASASTVVASATPVGANYDYCCGGYLFRYHCSCLRCYSNFSNRRCYYARYRHNDDVSYCYFRYFDYSGSRVVHSFVPLSASS